MFDQRPYFTISTLASLNGTLIQQSELFTCTFLVIVEDTPVLSSFCGLDNNLHNYSINILKYSFESKSNVATRVYNTYKIT